MEDCLGIRFGVVRVAVGVFLAVVEALCSPLSRSIAARIFFPFFMFSPDLPLPLALFVLLSSLVFCRAVAPASRPWLPRTPKCESSAKVESLYV